jgi:hypothetical protein
VYRIVVRSLRRQTGGRSSAGRAPALQAGGRRFESARLHPGNGWSEGCSTIGVDPARTRTDPKVGVFTPTTYRIGPRTTAARRSHPTEPHRTRPRREYAGARRSKSGPGFFNPSSPALFDIRLGLRDEEWTLAIVEQAWSGVRMDELRVPAPGASARLTRV